MSRPRCPPPDAGWIPISPSLLLLSLLCVGCGQAETLTAHLPLHLEDHIDVADVTGSEVPSDVRQPVEWRFDEPQPDWKPAKPIAGHREAMTPIRIEDALRLPLTSQTYIGPRLGGEIYVALPDWDLDDWAFVEIRARARGPVRGIELDFNYTETEPGGDTPFYTHGDGALVLSDGTVQTYRLSLDPSTFQRGRWEGPWTHLGIWFTANAAEVPPALDILSLRVVPRQAVYAQHRAGVRLEQRGTLTDSPEEAPYRRSLFMWAPGRLTYRVQVPQSGRLDVGLGVLRERFPVTFAVTATSWEQLLVTLLEETYADAGFWGQRSVDLSSLAGENVSLALEVRADRPGTVALLSAPTLVGRRSTEKPNVILYIIDGGGADYMSVYGYNRRTTPNLENLAAEGAIFENAYSNSSWTRPSTASFLTSLHHSVLGGLDSQGRNPVPDQALTMGQHMHRAGYQTAQFTSNSNAGRVISVEREIDFFRDFNLGNHSVSSVSLHEDFWQWRRTYPGEPYWVHVQTTDVHNWHHPEAPFAGLFISPERRRAADDWVERLRERWAVYPQYDVRRALRELGIDRVAFWTATRDLHDETMAHQDHQIGQLVARLKAAGEWERTLLVVAADHSVAAGAFDYALRMRDPEVPYVGYDHPEVPIFRPGVSRIPLIVVWSGRIAGGQRFSHPVSMIDILPTVLDLVDLPMPEVMQGQSLAPLLLGEPGWEPRPVILDEFLAHRETGELTGKIEVVDGRWGASLAVNGAIMWWTYQPRSVPLLLYDLWNDPQCLHSLHEERPDLVERYTAILEAQWGAHQALGQHFTPSESRPLTPEQLETLRALGYIR